MCHMPKIQAAIATIATPKPPAPTAAAVFGAMLALPFTRYGAGAGAAGVFAATAAASESDLA